MVSTPYRINYKVSDELETWLASLPNRIGIVEIGSNYTLVTYDHTPAESIAFKKALASRLGLDGDNVMKYMDEMMSDAALYTSEKEITKSGLSSTYVNLFTDFAARSFLVDTTGYTRVAIQIYWNKNGGASDHDLQIVNHADTTKVLYEKLNLTDGETLDANVTIPVDFINFTGKLRIRVKSGNGTDSPIFNAIRIYLRR